MRTQPTSPQPLAVAPALDAAELEGALTLTLRGGEACVLHLADRPAAPGAGAAATTVAVLPMQPVVTLTF